MVNQEKIIAALKEVITSVQASDNNRIMQALISLIQICHSEGMNADHVNQLLEQNGIQGGDGLRNFVIAQFAAINQA